MTRKRGPFLFDKAVWGAWRCDRLSEARGGLFITIARVGFVYHIHLKRNRRRIVDDPNVSGLGASVVSKAQRGRDREGLTMSRGKVTSSAIR